jgi:hypothetical protein
MPILSPRVSRFIGKTVAVLSERLQRGKIRAELDENTYEKGIKISDKELAKVNLHKEEFHGEWNYKIMPKL